jgi:hypothetical protein
MENLSVTNGTQFLDFKDVKVQDITMEQLRKTYKEIDGNTGLPNFGIYHFQLLDDLSAMSKEVGYETEIWDLFAAQNKDGRTPGVTLCPRFEEQYGERAVEAHTLRRVFANIRIKDFDTQEHTTNLAVAYHQRGIQVGFGTNVIICHNQCMLAKDKYASTYGNEKISVPSLIDTVKSWLIDARHIVETDRKRIERMKEISVTADETLRLIGMLTAVRVKHDSKHFVGAPDYPLNQAQISLYTEDLLKRYESAQRLSVWDLYDSATELYKVKTLDMPQVLPMNRLMVEFLENEFEF